MSEETEILVAAESLLSEVTEIRRDIHANPELGLDNPATQQKILAALDGLGFDISTGDATTSVIADLDGGGDGPTLLLRADTDALPMPEDTQESFSSTHPERAHACGHDAHTAMLLGAAKILSENRSEIAGRIRLMFQPGEEGFGGAKVMIDEGVLEGVDRAFAIHVTPNIPAGYVSSRPGPMLASADTFEIVVRGEGGHASSPHFCIDPVPGACAIVPALQTMITRELNAFDPALLTVTQINAGTTTNVIAETATLAGTIRAVSEANRARIHDSIHRVATSTCATHNCTAEVAVTHGYLVTVNHKSEIPLIEQAATEALGAGNYFEMPTPVMGAEDFSYILGSVPGAMAFLGVCPEDVDNSLTAAPNHSNKMRMSEAAMTSGVAMHVAMALGATAA
jgi:amidohydrolase